MYGRALVKSIRTLILMRCHASSVLTGILLSGLVSGCYTPPAIDQYQASRAAYVPGIPSFDMETVPSVPGEPSGLDLHLSVPSTSLTFEKVGERFRAMSEVRVDLLNAKDQTFVLERTWRDTMVVSSYRETQRHEPFLFRRRLDLPPGDYSVDVTFENLSSEKTTVRRQTVGIPDSAALLPHMGKILVRARTDRGSFLPVVPFFAPVGLDSLECAVKLVNLNPASASTATLDLVRYRSDTAPASPPMALTIQDLPLGYGMVSFESPDTAEAATRPITGTKAATLAISLRGLPLGNYKAAFQVSTPVDGPEPHDTLLRAERFISIGGPAFPRPSTLTELIEAMVYIARRDEMVLLREAPTPEIARTRFDSLWLTFRSDKSEAAKLINQYYSRVEEANQRFSSTKEGWRTDQGMVYIILGPPVDVMNTKDRQVWYYDLRGDDAVNVYTFQRRFFTDGLVSIASYTLFRQPYYEAFWIRMVEKWRSGEVF